MYHRVYTHREAIPRVYHRGIYTGRLYPGVYLGWYIHREAIPRGVQWWYIHREAIPRVCTVVYIHREAIPRVRTGVYTPGRLYPGVYPGCVTGVYASLVYISPPVSLLESPFVRPGITNFMSEREAPWGYTGGTCQHRDHPFHCWASTSRLNLRTVSERKAGFLTFG